MATGEQNGHVELARAEHLGDLDHGPGATVMPAGRLSIARTIKPLPPTVPFTQVQLARLDETINVASRATGLDFSIYLGDLGKDTRARAEELHASIGESAASDAVLIAVSPGQRAVEVVTGEEAHRRLVDRVCRFAAEAHRSHARALNGYSTPVRCSSRVSSYHELVTRSAPIWVAVSPSTRPAGPAL